MKHLIFKNFQSTDTNYIFEKVIISLDDLGILNPKDQFKANPIDPLIVDYNFYMPQVYTNIDSQRETGGGGADPAIRGVRIRARIDLNGIPFEKGEEPPIPTFSELLKETYVNAITANPGGDGPRGTSRNVVEMPAPQVRDAVSGKIYTGVWVGDLDSLSLDDVDVFTGVKTWQVQSSDCALELPFEAGKGEA